uniref:Uncharacterized protein n=1 Tax=Sphaerodactylus townsendi TaxID=933632 RepID=A0ACB8G576_9SAUR
MGGGVERVALEICPDLNGRRECAPERTSSKIKAILKSDGSAPWLTCPGLDEKRVWCSFSLLECHPDFEVT